MKSREIESNTAKHKRTTQTPSSPKGKHIDQETRRDAAKTYGLLASERNRIAAEKKSRRGTSSSKSFSAPREKSSSHKSRSKGHVSIEAEDNDDCSTSKSRVQAWLCDTSMLTVKLESIDDPSLSTDLKQSSETPSRSTAEKATQTPHSCLQSPMPQLSSGEGHTAISDRASSEKAGRMVCSREILTTAKGLPVYSMTSSCTVDENDREKVEEYETLSRIQELRERRATLLAEKRVILLRIEEIKLRQEVRALERDVTKSELELQRLIAIESQQTSSNPSPSRRSLSDNRGETRTERSLLSVGGDKDVMASTGATSISQETRKSDGGAYNVLTKTGTDAVHDNDSSSLPNNRHSEETLIAQNHQHQQQHHHLNEEPHCVLEANAASITNEDALALCIPDNDQSEIREYFSRSTDLRSAPAVLFSVGNEEEVAVTPFIKASSYDGVEKLSLCDTEIEDGLSKALDDAIKRLAGGRLNAAGHEPTDRLSEPNSHSETYSHSFDDEDEYSAMLDSIPLNTNTPDISKQDEEEETDSETKESRHGGHDSGMEDSAAMAFSSIPIFEETVTQLSGMTAMDQSASTVFCSPRNGRSSPRSPCKQLPDVELTRNMLSPEADGPSTDSSSQNQRQTTPISEVLITASSCSSCWVQFSQTDREYIRTIVIKYVQAFCDPAPPIRLNPNNLPIPLKTFAAIQKESPNSTVQEAFDRAVFDAVNRRLTELYQCFSAIKGDGIAVGTWNGPSYSCLLGGVLKTVLATTDCDADPLAAYISKENIIEQMLRKSAWTMQISSS